MEGGGKSTDLHIANEHMRMFIKKETRKIVVIVAEQFCTYRIQLKTSEVRKMKRKEKTQFENRRVKSIIIIIYNNT